MKYTNILVYVWGVLGRETAKQSLFNLVQCIWMISWPQNKSMSKHFSIRYPTRIQNGVCAMHTDVDVTDILLEFFWEENL